MLLIDTSRPATRELILQRLWLSNAVKWISLGVPNQPNNTDRLSPILFCPPCQVVEGIGVELHTPHRANFETTSSSDTPFPRSFAASNRFRIVSDRNRYAVSRSDSISFQRAIGTMTAVVSPASLDTTWISTSVTPSF